MKLKKPSLITLSFLCMTMIGCEESLELAKLQSLSKLANGDQVLSCTPGKVLSISVDQDGDGVFETKKGSITSYSGELSAQENYDYYSWSAHPINGPMPAGFESHVFLYEGSDGLSLNMYHNVDEGGSAANSVSWDIATLGNAAQDDIILQDDFGEVFSLDPTTYLQENISPGFEQIADYLNEGLAQVFRGSWSYWYNTDGVVLGPFEGENFSIIVSGNYGGDVNNVAFYSADGQFFDLSDAQGELHSFEIKYEDDQTCEGFNPIVASASSEGSEFL